MKQKKVIPKIKVKVTMTKVEPGQLYKIGSSKDAFICFTEVFNKDTFLFAEEMQLLCLSQANEVIGAYRVGAGGKTGTVADLRNIFTVALNSNACNIIIAHNHPSGNLKASEADIKLTKQIKESGNFLTINLVDSLILGSFEKYYSFADEGIF
jgi:DNA repair protein RadC